MQGMNLLAFLMAALLAFQASDDAPYSRKFFTQLRGVFGRFREADLQRAFERAQPIQCSELINGEGEWRPVAFFNEKRELGDWYRANLEEVKSDLSTFIFKGVCRGDHGPVQLTTKFPVKDTTEINVNAAVRASFDGQTDTYTFDLPYLFLVSRTDGESLYSLIPQTLDERSNYARDVIDHWTCKSVTAENVTYQFLLCRTTTLPSNASERRQFRPGFGAAAYFILSDGKEAASNVRLSFGDGDSVKDESTKAAEVAPAPAAWEAPEPDEKLVDVFRDEFRLTFNRQSWAGRLGSSQGLSGGQLSNLASFNPPNGADYCMWLPAGSSVSGEPAQYSVTAHDQDGQTPTSISFDVHSARGDRMGTLQCSFPRLQSVAGLPYSRWKALAGVHLTLEVR